jgi:hypothetical protein
MWPTARATQTLSQGLAATSFLFFFDPRPIISPLNTTMRFAFKLTIARNFVLRRRILFGFFQPVFLLIARGPFFVVVFGWLVVELRLLRASLPATHHDH